jgi:outer membrane protein OmpA-like peptidoglycan-associated protein
MVRGCAVVAMALLTAACASTGTARAPETPASHSGQDLVVLLPDPGTGAVGRASVSNRQGRVELTQARESTLVRAGAPPSAPSVLTEGEPDRLFAEVLEALPPAPRHFTLYFKFESEDLTDESRQLVQDVLQEVKARPVPDVVAIGHTDTTGSARGNVQLGLRRANAVRTILVSAGLSQSAVSVTSHGEAELLVPTADGVSEPRNRRVEITVRGAGPTGGWPWPAASSPPCWPPCWRRCGRRRSRTSSTTSTTHSSDRSHRRRQPDASSWSTSTNGALRPSGSGHGGGTSWRP